VVNTSKVQSPRYFGMKYCDGHWDGQYCSSSCTRGTSATSGISFSKQACTRTKLFTGASFRGGVWQEADSGKGGLEKNPGLF
jgi:hypothetical protein